MFGVNMPLQRVIRSAVPVFAQGFGIAGFADIIGHSGPQNPRQSVDLGGVGVVLSFGLGVVLAVNGGPFLGDHAGGHPQPEAEKVGHDRMQRQRAVRLTAVQENSDGGDGDMSQRQRVNNGNPPRRVPVSVDENGGDLFHGNVSSFYACLFGFNRKFRPI